MTLPQSRPPGIRRKPVPGPWDSFPAGAQRPSWPIRSASRPCLRTLLRADRCPAASVWWRIDLAGQPGRPIVPGFPAGRPCDCLGIRCPGLPPDQCSQAPGARSRPTQHRQACRSRSLARGPCRAAGLRAQLAASAEGAPHGVAGREEPACPSADACSGAAKARLSRIGCSGFSGLCGHQAATACRTGPIARRCGRASEPSTRRTQHAG